MDFLGKTSTKINFAKLKLTQPELIEVLAKITFRIFKLPMKQVSNSSCLDIKTFALQLTVIHVDTIKVEISLQSKQMKTSFLTVTDKR